MPLSVMDFPALPECGGSQWSVVDLDQLAGLTALVLLGHSSRVARILQGALRGAASPPSEVIKAHLRKQLILTSEQDPWHRDGLLFEIICWIVAHMNAGAYDVISEPHLTPTEQGADVIQVSFDISARRVLRATIHEQKCTDHPRDKFRDEVLPTFRDWILGVRDNQLSQFTIGLLERYELDDGERIRIYDQLAKERPLAFCAALTVTPAAFDTTKYVALFKDFASLNNQVSDRQGDTFPLSEVRAWFDQFAHKVWIHIDTNDV